jgi:hypothetical protein
MTSTPVLSYLPVEAALLPLDLQRLPFVLWRAEPRSGDPKPAKVPYRVSDPEQRASSTNPTTWSTFADASEAYSALVGQSHPRGPIAGLGVVLTSDARIVCLDLDGVVASDRLDSRAAWIVQACDSWTEISPSGTGLHVFVRGTVPHAMKGAGIEVYAHARYIAVTGLRCPGTPATLQDAQPYLDILAALGRPEARRPYTGPITSPPDDLAGALLAKLTAWGAAHGPIRRWEDGYLVELQQCPWAGEHTTGLGGAAVMIRASGAYDFTCLHAHCAGRTWRDLRGHMDAAPR